MTEDLRDAGIDVKFLPRDRGGKFGPGFDMVWQGEKASVVGTPVRAPDANAICERWARTVRTDCLILNERHLRRMLDRYVWHYNEHRPYRGLAMQSPVPSPSEIPAMLTSIRRQEVLGGLISEYHAA